MYGHTHPQAPVACVAAAAPDLHTLAGQDDWTSGLDGWTPLMKASQACQVEALRVLIEKGALIEAADEVRIHSHANTHARSQALIHTHMHTLACERTI